MPNIGIQDSYNNVKLTCDSVRDPGMNNAERQAVNESLQNIAKALQAGIAMEAKIELLEKQVAETIDEGTEEIPEDA